MLVKITDQAGTSGTVIVDSGAVANTIRPWFPEAPAEVKQAISELQDAIDTDDHRQHGLAAFLAIGIYAAPSWIAAAVTLPTTEMASWLYDTAATGAGTEISGTTVLLSSASLRVLAVEVDKEADGHYDGQHIWITGSEYAVEKV